MQCKPTVRLSVIIPETSLTGVWNLRTNSWAATREMEQMVALIDMAQTRGLVAATLAIEPRKQVSGGKTKNFVVPVLRLQASLYDLAAGAGVATLGSGSMAGLTPPPAPAHGAGGRLPGMTASLSRGRPPTRCRDESTVRAGVGVRQHATLLARRARPARDARCGAGVTETRFPACRGPPAPMGRGHDTVPPRCDAPMERRNDGPAGERLLQAARHCHHGPLTQRPDEAPRAVPASPPRLG